MNVKKYWFISFVFLALVNCSGKPIDENNPTSLYEDALDDVKNERYQIAMEKLRSIRNKFPYSNVATEAHLKIADVYFLQEAFIEAAAAYEAFKDLHPKHVSSSFAGFRIGESYFKDIPSTISRDLTSAVKAEEALKAFLDQYGKDERAAEAKKYLIETRTALASKELYIADFYYNRENWDAASKRYQKVIDLYPETETATLAKNKLEEASKKK